VENYDETPDDDEEEEDDGAERIAM